MNRFAQILVGLALSASALSAFFALVSLQTSSERLSVNWGGLFYLVSPLPYVVAAILAVSFRRNIKEVVISLAGSVAIGPLGVYVMRTAEDALTVQFGWFLSVLGCIVILLIQLFGRAGGRGKPWTESNEQ